MKHFTSLQRATLCAALDRIIPPDDYPSATQNGVLEYLERQFDRDLQPLLETYHHGLDALHYESHLHFEQNFAHLAPPQQDSVLSRIEHGDVAAAWPVEPRQFFQLLTQHCAEGYYSDPGNGGNPQMASWKMVGFDQGVDL
ncbi:MAG TPA: gluconate 2-dehydrogenase subunit 3 family protein [Abditibacteriaceae bacterium]